MRRLPRLVSLLLLFAGALLLSVQAQEAGDDGRAPADVRVMTIQEAIGPAVSDWFLRTLADAEAQGADLLVVELDTPGGLSKSMRDMIQGILSSKVPVATYVTPRGARAASAGTYLLYASHVAAMAPATNLGSATPVQIGGGGGQDEGGGSPFSLQADDGAAAGETSKDGTAEGASEEGDGASAGQSGDAGNASAIEKKVINDAVAYIRGLAELRGRNADWAEQAVREAVNLSSSAALEKNVIDIRADSLEDMLAQADAMEVDVDGVMQTLTLADHRISRIQKDWRTEFLTVITDPSVAYILMLVGIYGLILEFYNPGMGVPGVVGAICLLVGLYALQMLPISYVGLALMLLGIGLMVVEAVSPSFGILGVGGAVAFVIGSVMLMDTDLPGYQIAMPVIAAFSVSTFLIMVLVLRMALQSTRKAVVSGSEGMQGTTAVAIRDFDGGVGWVRVLGEIWQAHSADPVREGDVVVIQNVEGLKLTVRSEGQSND
ncbi:nodulation protein NfeD [Halospina sp. K52047b]|uniref:NfeD family protein n=1 Tax=Halospina sp. K52047b TaxID=2614160 RepID=UPI001249FC54|nr:nodulation protein NfeD [Halospina sp. K52047b]KAA8977040.1 nodulation protein NfeD [Halospina sp. K52047b]